MRPKKIILCVDSSEVDLSCLACLLETRGHRVLTATTAAQALEIVEGSMPGKIDLVVSELRLLGQDGMDGNDLCRAVKAWNPELRVLLISRTVKQYERGLNADVFLPKCVCTPAEIVERVRQLTMRKRGPKKARTVVQYTELATRIMKAKEIRL